jgi:hypothetical protein
MMSIIQELMKQMETRGDIPNFGGKYKNYTPTQNKARGMKAGGTASARADGCAIKGKTKGKMV